MKSITAASLGFAIALSLAPLQAYAQGNPNNTNSLAARLAAVEARLAKLEGQIVAADLVGEYHFAGILIDPDASNPPVIGVAVASGTLTLLADGTGSFSGAFTGTDLVLSNPALASPFFQPDTVPLTWTYANGTLTITDPEEVIAFDVSVGGRVLTLSVIGDDGDHDLFILTRLR